MDFPEPVISVAVEPKTKSDMEKMTDALIKLAAEDPSFRFRRDEDSGQTVISGMGELHLEIIVDRMKREFKVEANVGAPQVAYRECITKTTEIEHIHKKQSGGSGQYAKVILFLCLSLVITIVIIIVVVIVVDVVIVVIVVIVIIRSRSASSRSRRARRASNSSPTSRAAPCPRSTSPAWPRASRASWAPVSSRASP